jgi:hypothetical protein
MSRSKLPREVQLMTSREVAAFFGVTVQTIYRWAERGLFPNRPDGTPGWLRLPSVDGRGDLRFHRDAVEHLARGRWGVPPSIRGLRKKTALDTWRSYS